MRRYLPILLLILSLPALAAPPSLADIVEKKDYAAAHKLAAKIAQAAGVSIETDLPPTSSVEKGAKLSYRLVVTDQPLNVLNVQGCVVLTTAPLRTGSYISDSLIISSAAIQSGSYLNSSTVLTGSGLRVGSYSTGNTIEAKQVRVGSYSSGSTYHGVKPQVGKPGKTDTHKGSSILSKYLTL